jgi:sulfoxide reductase heme-binding subunit YedZ
MDIHISRAQLIWLKALIHLLAALPLANLYYQAYRDTLGADPVEVVIHFTGMGALNLLILTLLVSPFARQSNLGLLLRCRRMLGLYAFAYALCHILNFFFFEVQLDLQLFVEEVFEGSYITIGMLAFLILSALAVTSMNTLRRRMGAYWQNLHNLIYLSVLLVLIHFYWSVKSDIAEPLVYFFLFALLMLFRYQKIRQWAIRRLSKSSRFTQ